MAMIITIMTVGQPTRILEYKIDEKRQDLASYLRSMIEVERQPTQHHTAVLVNPAYHVII